MEVVKGEVLCFEPLTLCLSNSFLVFFGTILAKPSNDSDYNAHLLEISQNFGKLFHIPHGLGFEVRACIFCPQLGKPVFNSVEVSDSAVHVEADFVGGVDSKHFKYLLISFVVFIIA